MTQYPDLFAALAAPFEQKQVKSLSKGATKIFYVTARTVMNRLDEVLGPENWWDGYRPGGESSVICALTIRLPDGQTITKEDAGGFAGMADSGDDDKSGYSDAFKRAAVKFGVGRYLYRDGVPSYESPSRAETVPSRAETAPAPASLGWVHGETQTPAPPSAPTPTRVNNPKPTGPPRSGKALFAWAKDQEQSYDVGLLKYLNQWASRQGFPVRMVEWDATHVALAHAEALRKLDSFAHANGNANGVSH